MVTLYCSLIVEEFNGAYACVIVQKIWKTRKVTHEKTLKSRKLNWQWWLMTTRIYRWRKYSWSQHTYLEWLPTWGTHNKWS